MREEIREDRARTALIGIRKGRATDRPGAQMVMVGRLDIPQLDQLAEARNPAQLAVQQRHEMVPAVEVFPISVALVLRHDGSKHAARNHFQDLAENRILIAHARLSFLCLDNQKVAPKRLQRLACTCDKVNHSPDNPARKRESSFSESLDPTLSRG